MKFTLKRTQQFLDILASATQQSILPITNISFSESRDGSVSWQPYVPGSYWGENDKWYRFRVDFCIPQAYDGCHVKCRLTTGRETQWSPLNPQFLLRINGEVVQALDTNHYTFEISRSASAGEVFAIDFEGYAGREVGNLRFHDRPLQFVLEAYCHNADCERLYYDLRAAKMAAEIYPEGNYNRIQAETALANTLNLLDCRVPGSPEFFASVKRAADYMEEAFYGKVCGHEEAIANCVGHTHIDVAWLWQLEQTRAKAVRSFATEIALMDEYPEHLFSSSQPQLYQFVKEDCPELYKKIKERVKEGRWEVEGAMWLEADCNLSSGESLIRQILHGKRFMKEEFDVDSKVLWLPDVFGYAAALPQILCKSGVHTFITSKIHWSDTNHFPYDTFSWKGIDGSEVFTQYITAADVNAKLGDGNKYSTYCGQILPISLAKGWEIYQQKDINNEILVSFGYGDGGGGVTREMLEMYRRLNKSIPGVPTPRITTIADSLQRIKNNVAGKKLPKWFGELYLEFHRGTYTSVAKNKRYNRKAEFLMQTVEAAGVTDKLLLKGTYDKQAIYDSWQTILLNQFHDIIPGSSIREVYEDSDKQYAVLFAENDKRLCDALAHLAENVSQPGIFVYNPTGTAQSGLVEWGGKQLYAENVPAWGWTVLEEVPAEAAPCFQVSTTHLENDFFSIDLDEKGHFTSLFDKRNNRQVLAEGQRGNVLEAFDDHPYEYDNWELSSYHKDIRWEIDDVQSIEVVEVTPLSASLKITRKFLSSTIEQIIIIYKDIPRIDFDTKVDWHEHHLFIKVAFPVDILSDKATYEIQYGAVERPAHSNTSWDSAKYEVCAHKWADFGEAGYGVALMNDCKYGYDIHDGVMRLSLIKCGTYPNEAADQGEHIFTYSLMPHSGDWREAGVDRQAYALNCPLLAVPTDGKGVLPETYSFVRADKDNIFITAAKEACDSEDLILRVYETQGKRTDATITCGFSFARAAEVDMMENEVYALLAENADSFSLRFKPFEIKTFRIRK